MNRDKDFEEYRAAVARVRELIGNWLNGGVDVFLELQKIDKKGIWRIAYSSFGDFLSREFPNALGLNRYENVIHAIAVYGEKRVRQVGVEGCHALLCAEVVKSEDKRSELEASIDRHVQVTGTPPPPREIRRIVRGILETPSPLAKATISLRRDSALAQEVVLLRAQLREAKKRIRELEAQLRKATGKHTPEGRAAAE
ncbi:MAG TPA: hypothetical protein VFQ61_06580 [Polyangiaceae bacterium]|nr:hypothetical protein [Polyangiaceae bacterium]